MEESSGIVTQNQKQLLRRKIKLSTIIIWAVFILVVVICLRVGTQSQRINNEIILMAVADELGKDSRNLTKADYLNLKELDLSSSMITDIKLLKKFPNLQKLNLSKTPSEITTIPPAWEIVLRRWGLKKKTARKQLDLKPLEKLHNLETLILREAAFKSLEPIANLKSMKELDLQFTKISNFGPLQGLTNLERLNLNFTGFLDTGLLVNLINLQELEIRNTLVTKIEPLTGLTNLKTLNICGTEIEDIEPVNSFKNLQLLNIISCNRIPYWQIEDLQKTFPNLKIINRYGMGY